jgi:hypothetical protein
MPTGREEGGGGEVLLSFLSKTQISASILVKHLMARVNSIFALLAFRMLIRCSTGSFKFLFLIVYENIYLFYTFFVFLKLKDMNLIFRLFIFLVLYVRMISRL